MSDFVGIVTTLGQQKIAAAIGGTALNLTTIRVGDGNGAPITPNAGMTDLVRRVGAAYAITSSGRDPVNANYWRVSTVIPETDGPFDIREIAVFDSAGDMIAIARHVLVEKRAPAQGAAVELTTDIVFPVSDTAQVTVTIAPSGAGSLLQQLRPPFLVVDGVLTTPPATPAIGATVLVAAGATGAFAGQAYKLAQWTGVWEFKDVAAGHLVVDESKAEDASNRWLRRTAAGWVNAIAATNALGVIRLASHAEADAGANSTAALTPSLLKSLTAGSPTATALSAALGVTQGGGTTSIGVTVGTVHWVTSNTSPAGYIKANGALLSRAAYPDLWAHAQVSGMLIAEAAWQAGDYSKFSSGDGATTFRVPDLRGYAVRALDDGAGVDVGRVLGSRQADAIAGHTHALQAGGTASGFNSIKGGYNFPNYISALTSTDYVHEILPLSGLVTATQAGAASETRVKSVALLAIIKF